MVVRSDVVAAMIRAAVRAGESLEAAFLRPELLSIREKAAADFVSDADLRSQEIIRCDLGAAFPDYGFLLEEDTGADARPAARFIVDPLDGTTNFIRGIPHFAVSIALDVNGETVGSTVVDPVKREVFWAEKGLGAWLGERRLWTSREDIMSRAIVGTGIPHHGRGDHPPYLDALAAVMRDVAGVRRLGAAALDLAYVAAGRFDAFFEQGLAPWDVAGGTLLVREAGGVVTRTDGRVEHLSGDVAASSSARMHNVLLRWLAPLHRAPR